MLTRRASYRKSIVVFVVSLLGWMPPSWPARAAFQGRRSVYRVLLCFYCTLVLLDVTDWMPSCARAYLVDGDASLRTGLFEEDEDDDEEEEELELVRELILPRDRRF